MLQQSRKQVCRVLEVLEVVTELTLLVHVRTRGSRDEFIVKRKSKYLLFAYLNVKKVSAPGSEH